MNTAVEIEAALLNEVATVLNTAPENLDPETPLHELGVDSLSLVELFVFVEKTYRFKLMTSGIRQEDLRSLRSLARCIAHEIDLRG